MARAAVRPWWRVRLRFVVVIAAVLIAGALVLAWLGGAFGIRLRVLNRGAEAMTTCEVRVRGAIGRPEFISVSGLRPGEHRDVWTFARDEVTYTVSTRWASGRSSTGTASAYIDTPFSGWATLEVVPDSIMCRVD